MKLTKKIFVVTSAGKSYTFVATKMEAPVREKVLLKKQSEKKPEEKQV